MYNPPVTLIITSCDITCLGERKCKSIDTKHLLKRAKYDQVKCATHSN